MTGKAGGQVDVILAAVGLNRLYHPCEAARALRGQGGRYHRESGHNEHELGGVVGQQTHCKTESDDKEGKFAALAEQQGGTECDGAWPAGEAREPIEDRSLDQEQPGHRGSQPERFCGDLGNVYAHPDGKKKKPSSSPLNGSISASI